MFYLFLFLFFSSLIAPSSTTEFFAKGEASAGSRYLVELAKEFDAGHVYGGYNGKTIIPSPQPIDDQLQNIDENRTATTKDVEAIFKTILILRYHRQPLETLKGSASQLLSQQFMAYQVMDIACQSLLEKPISLTELKEKTIIKTHEQESLRHFSEAYITALIPDTAVTMVQYPEPIREINYLRLHDEPILYAEHQLGVLLGNYDRKKTFEALQVEKDQNKAIYLVLGRGNRQLVPENQKTTDGRDIVWVYLDGDARYHSVNSKEYFLWEDFNGYLRDRLPDNFFDAVIFDNSVVKFMATEMLTVYQILKILKDDGFLIFESTFNGGGFPGMIFTTSEYQISSGGCWPSLQKIFCRGCGELLKEQQRKELYQKLYIDFIKALEDEFSYLFKKVEKVTADENLGFQLAQYGSSEERPTFKLTGPKKDLKGLLTDYYWQKT